MDYIINLIGFIVFAYILLINFHYLQLDIPNLLLFMKEQWQNIVQWEISIFMFFLTVSSLSMIAWKINEKVNLEIKQKAKQNSSDILDINKVLLLKTIFLLAWLWLVNIILTIIIWLFWDFEFLIRIIFSLFLIIQILMIWACIDITTIFFKIKSFFKN